MCAHILRLGRRHCGVTLRAAGTHLLTSQAALQAVHQLLLLLLLLLLLGCICRQHTLHPHKQGRLLCVRACAGCVCVSRPAGTASEAGHRQHAHAVWTCAVQDYSGVGSYGVGSLTRKDACAPTSPGIGLPSQPVRSQHKHMQTAQPPQQGQGRAPPLPEIEQTDT